MKAFALLYIYHLSTDHNKTKLQVSISSVVPPRRRRLVSSDPLTAELHPTTEVHIAAPVASSCQKLPFVPRSRELVRQSGRMTGQWRSWKKWDISRGLQEKVTRGDPS